jgi:predicted Holliday junction resolvase-like endonuclease
MKATIGDIFGALAHLMGVCPCCGEPFHVSEARPYYEGEKRRSPLDKLRAEERRLEEAEQRLDELEWKLRERAAKAGLGAAKRLLRKIDPTFSGAGYDPQDVKVMFDPVTYIVFDGMAKGEMKEVQLLATPPQNGATALIQKSIDRAIRRGNVEFRTLRVGPDGGVF